MRVIFSRRASCKMPTDPRHVQLATARAAAAAAEKEVTSLNAALLLARNTLDSATRLGDSAGVKAAQAEITRLTPLLSTARTQLKAGLTQVEQQRSSFAGIPA